MPVAVVPRLLMTVVAAGWDELVQNAGQVMLQSWLELNRAGACLSRDLRSHILVSCRRYGKLEIGLPSRVARDLLIVPSGRAFHAWYLAQGFEHQCRVRGPVGR